MGGYNSCVNVFMLCILASILYCSLTKCLLHSEHDLISLLIRLGFSAVAIGNRVGHESQTITFHYAHMFPTEQIEMADKLNEEFVPCTGNGGDVQ